MSTDAQEGTEINLADERGWCSPLVANVIWAFFGGIEYFIGWAIIGALLCVTIVGIPQGKQCFGMGKLALWPIGRTVVQRSASYECPSLLGRILWFPFGITICVSHIMAGIFCYIIIVGIPFGPLHFKFAKLALFPFDVDFTDSASKDGVVGDEQTGLLA